MTSPLSGIASQIYSGFKDIFFNATLTRDTVTDSSPDVAFDPTITSADYACKAIRDGFITRPMGGGLAKVGDVKILILANSITVTPRNGDRVVIDDDTVGGTFVIIETETDPATALWTCAARK
jgi:hypothetical protein